MERIAKEAIYVSLFGKKLFRKKQLITFYRSKFRLLSLVKKDYYTTYTICSSQFELRFKLTHAALRPQSIFFPNGYLK